ncbi:MAG TPA: Zn-dependent alcohol dehydrogenase [Acetobacteraceae bacterium]|nr:Zn-dependent alcohol dehydrogenase [Acetobacteraceae bacterium]
MRAAVLHEARRPMTIETLTVAKPKAHEVLLRTAYAGLCHSDLHFMEGLYPMPTPVVLGHESSAIVEAVGSEVTYVKLGDRVITCLSVFCGTCSYCNTGRPQLCDDPEVKQPPGQAQRLFWDGKPVAQAYNLSSFAEQLLVHENAMVKIAEDIPLDIAALVGCGVMTGVGAVINTAKVPAGSTVAVFGCGGIGLSAVNGAAIAGADRIIAVDTVSTKLDVAKQMGATDVINASNADPVEAIKELTGGGVEFSFEAVGLKRTAEQSFESLRPGGTATIIGMIPFGVKIELHGADFLRERRIQGSSMGSNRFRVDMPRLLNQWKRGHLKLDHLISGHIKLDEINDGYAKLKEGSVLRQLIDFGVAA